MVFKIIQALRILSLLNGINGGLNEYLKSNYPASVLEDAMLDTPGLLTKYKFPVETHFVTTSDKYILCMHRMPRPHGKPIFLMHGLLDSSATWILMGPWSGLGYYLYENGFDVWMGNARGNRYSRNHTSYNPDTNGQFWKFSWHEIGYYDLHAMIDYVLQQTHQKKLSYIGHSQGTTSFFVMCSEHSDCSSKVSSMHAIAPVAFMKNIKTPLLPVGRLFYGFIENGLPEMFPHNYLTLNACFSSKQTINTCLKYFLEIMGKESKEANATMWPVIFGHIPAGAAGRQAKHYLQLVESNRFCQYDFGASGNFKRYGKMTPPDYRLDNIKVPIGLYYSYNDYLTSEIDVERLARLLPNVIENNLLPYKKWSHITPVWGINARELLHKRIIEIISKFA